MARQTIRVTEVLDMVNARLATPDSTLRLTDSQTGEPWTPAQAFRMGAASLLESILFSTDTYAGYRNTDVTVTREDDTDHVIVGDDTRRAYIAHRAIRRD